MKRILRMAALACMVVLGSSLINTTAAQYYDEDREVSYQNFYDELSPHGRWVDNPDHGYVWLPNAGDDFRPYSTNGHWVWTEDAEWMWVSDYDWGWAPFHYGRWEQDPYYGWFWVPGYEWSPAWVAWRDGGDYYGWAPLRPGININLNYNMGGYNPPVDYWCFAPRRYINSPRIHDYYIDRRRNVTIIHQTVIINNYNYGGNYGYRTGPSRYDAERYCGRINPVRFRETYNPGRTFYRNNEVSVYRPQVRRDNDQTFSPRQVERYDRSNGQFRTIRTDEGRRDNVNTNGGNTDRRFRTNDLPERRIDDANRNDNGNGRRFERTTDNGQTGNGGDRRISRPEDRRDINTPNDNSGRRFERRHETVDQPQRQPDRQMERRQEPRPQEQARQFERRQETVGQPQRQPDRQIERRQMQQPQEQPRQFERRHDNGGQPQRQPVQQQVERRQEPRPQQQPQQRQFERRSNDGGNNQPGSDNGGNGNGRGRRF